MVRTMFDFLALAVMRQFVICGTLDLTLANGQDTSCKVAAPVRMPA